MTNQKYVIYVWDTRTLGPIVCAKSFVKDDEMQHFIEHINTQNGCRVIDITTPINTERTHEHD